ncbi:hypothetical protein F3087_20855 [Nocardia colli]|uniref:Uncharacterized protein n=1 Tax=Nocardia colli TaxID=2545717 RepID=A0A5N0EDX6_9NOCA|nr:hypothetical protein [Nocardia colli]KAA8887010.1 hypothetical protein F3087_20855 [Nocardia colli]
MTIPDGMTAQSMERFAMTIKRVTGPRISALLAAGVLATSVLGYSTICAPASTAEGGDGPEASEDLKCTGGKGTVSIAENDDGVIVGAAFLGGGFTKESGSEKSRCPREQKNPDEPLGRSGKVAIAKKGDACEISAKIGEAEVEVEENGETTIEKSQAGSVVVTAPLNDAKWTAKANDKAKDGDGEEASITAEGDIQGVKLTDCATVPQGIFKVTNIVATMKGR